MGPPWCPYLQPNTRLFVCASQTATYSAEVGAREEKREMKALNCHQVGDDPSQNIISYDRSGQLRTTFFPTVNIDMRSIPIVILTFFLGFVVWREAVSFLLFVSGNLKPALFRFQETRAKRGKKKKKGG
jgi:hypothetical protein